MKKYIHHKTFNVLLLVLSLFLSATLSAYDLERTHSVTKEVSVNASTKFNFYHQRGPLTIEYYNGATAIIEVNLVARGDVEEDLDLLLSKFKLEESGGSGNKTIKSDDQIKEWNQKKGWFSGEKTRIKFQDGTQINSKIEEYTATAVLKIPMVQSLGLSNKYYDIDVPDVPFNLTVDLFSGKLTGGNVQGDFEAKIKYGSGTIGDVQNSKLDLFDSKFDMSSVHDLEMKDKYSKIKIGPSNSVNAESFDSNLELGSIKGAFDINGKYCEVIAKDFEQGKWDVFDSDIRFTNAKHLDVKTKYSEFGANEVIDMEVHSFDDNFDIERVGNLNSSQSKYSEYTIDEFQGAFKIGESFDDIIRLEVIGSGFAGFEVESKYSKISLPLSDRIKFQLDAKMKYGGVEFNQEDFDVSSYIKENSEINIQAKVKGAVATSPKVVIRGFSTELKL